MTISTSETAWLPSSQYLPLSRKRILFIEDEENDVILVRHAFEKSGLPHEFIVLEDSRSAIDYLERQVRLGQGAVQGLPDLVILDLKLVGSSGFDVLVWLRQQPALQRIPVIVFSSSWVEKEVDRALQLGASEYSVKPSGFDDLMEWGRELHGKWLASPMPC